MKNSKFKKGEVKDIHGVTLGGKKVIEGRAKLISLVDVYHDGEMWRVKFNDDDRVTQRMVFYNEKNEDR